MANKVQLTESQLISVIEMATRDALRKINEGATFDTMKRVFNNGIDDPDEKPNYKKFIKNGDGEENYDDFVDNSKRYKEERKTHQRAKDHLDLVNRRVKNGADPVDAKHPEAVSREKNAYTNREAAAADKVLSRPGALGKLNRTAVVGAHLAGKGIGKVKRGTKNFVNNKIGINTNK